MILAWTNLSRYGEVLEKVKGCLFLGVPHRGADLARWAKIPAHFISYASVGFAGNTRFLDSLESVGARVKRLSTLPTMLCIEA